MDARIVSVTLCLLLAACNARQEIVYEPVEVTVPIPVRAEPPPELLLPIMVETPTWVTPADSDAVVSLREQDARQMLRLLSAIKTRLEAWRAWALGGGE